jgi:peptidoglycan/LPS O-acetylase OafA/YrhL
MNKGNKEYFYSLNGLRGLSITSVLLGHISSKNWIFNDLEKIFFLRPFIGVIQDSQMGVNLFFIISGFLITSIIISEEKITGKINLKNFFFKRIIRIFPVYFALLFVYLIFHLLGIIFIPKESWITAITYTKYFNWKVDWYTAHGWSLSIEEHFYLVWPLIFYFFKNFRRKIIFFIIIMVPFIRYFSHKYHITGINNLTILYRIDAIAFGCLIAFYKNYLIKKINTIYFIISLFIIVFFEEFLSLLKVLNLNNLMLSEGHRHGLVINICLSMVLIYSVFGPKKIMFKILNSKVLSFVGTISYSIYIWQQPFLSDNNYWINNLPQSIILVFLISILSYYLIEKPFLRLKKFVK